MSILAAALPRYPSNILLFDANMAETGLRSAIAAVESKELPVYSRIAAVAHDEISVSAAATSSESAMYRRCGGKQPLTEALRCVVSHSVSPASC